MAILIVYCQAIHFDFNNYDNNLYVTENQQVQAGLTVGGFCWAFATGHTSNWHPLTWLSHMLDCELYGLNPMGHHWTNIQIHIANSLLLFLLLNIMTGAIWRSGFVAALFALHPHNEALRINSDYAGAYYNLGKIFANQGKTEDAILHFQKALQKDPDMTQALYNLSWIGATSEDDKFRNSIEAIKLAEKLCNLQNYSQPLFLDALAVAYAEAGRFKEAVLTARKGLELALKMGSKELALGLEKRLKLYQTERPYQDACT